MIKNFEQFILDSYNGEFLNFIEKRSNLFPINESQESKSQSDAIKLLMDKLGWDKQKANNFVRVDLRNDITPLRDKQIGKFTLGVTRMFIKGELKDANTIGNLNATLKLLSAHLNEYDRNLNGLSADELISKFETTRKNNVEDEKKEISKLKFGVSDYEIVKIDSFNDAKKYYNYTNPRSRWCLTYTENMFDSYTCNGINQIYFCLKNGFEDIKPIVGENRPLDEYGLSMLSIIVNENGELAYCTPRWNHDNGGSDSVMDAVEISKVVNVNFYETFKPNNKWKTIIDVAKNKLANGEPIEDIFDEVSDFKIKDGYIIVKLNKKYNVINTDGDYLFDNWFDYIGEKLNEGNYVIVKSKNKFNFININGNNEYLLDKWFDWISNFDDESGFAAVEENKKGNYINSKGEYLLDEWFDETYSFKNGYAKVAIKEENDDYEYDEYEDEDDDNKYISKYNFIDIKGNIIFDEWFDRIDDLKNGYFKVKLNERYNFINSNCEYLSKDWFLYISYLENKDGDKNGLAIITKSKNGRSNIINSDCNFLFDEWYDWVGDFNRDNGFVKVFLNNKYNFINIISNGDEYLPLSNEWFNEIGDFKDGIANVNLNGKYNFINTKGEYLFEKWIKGNYISNFENGYAKILMDGKYNFINKKGEYLFDKWFDDVSSFYKNGYAMVKLDGKYNFININGDYLSNDWFEKVRSSYFENSDYAEVKLNGKYNFIKSNGKYLSDEWFDDVEYRDNHNNIKIRLNGKWNFINKDGEYLFDKWFDTKYGAENKYYYYLKNK